MKFTMWATAALLAFFSVMHVFVTYEHVRGRSARTVSRC